MISDQLTKWLIKINFNLYERMEVIKGFFDITHVRNSGAVWGIFSNHPNLLISKIITGLSILALLVVLYYFLKIDSDCKFELTSLSFIIGGALGNIIDRLVQGNVVDFLDFYIKGSHWPTFNIADTFITLGVTILIISIWRGKCTQF